MYGPRRTKVFCLLIPALIFSTVWLFQFKKKCPPQEPLLQLLKDFSFSKSEELKEWDEKVFKKRVKYSIKTLNKEDCCVYAQSKNNASALYYKIKIEMEKEPILSWKWNVIKFPDKKPNENLKDAKEDDYGARMYIIFPAFILGNMSALEYVWTEYLPKGSVSSSPYTPNIKLIVLESGYSKEGQWTFERRDLRQDYIEFFGKEPTSDACAIAIMTDSDSTKSSAEAIYDDIKIEYKKGGRP